MHERDVLTQEPTRGEIGDHAAPRAPRTRVGVDAHAELPSQRPLLRDRVEIGRPGHVEPEGDARHRPGRAGEPGDELAVGGRRAHPPSAATGVDEHGAQPGVGVRLERGLREAGVGRDGRPIDDGRDPRLGRAQHPDQGGGVDVLGLVVIGDLRRHRGLPARAVFPDVAEQRRPRMTMGVDEARA